MFFLRQPRLILISAFLTTLYSSALTEVEGYRSWTNNKNKNIQASLVKIVTEKDQSGKKTPVVTFKIKNNGKKVTFPVSKLSEAHQKELLSWYKRKPSGIATPMAPHHWPREYNGGTSVKVNYIGLDQKRNAHHYKTKHFDFYIEEKLGDSTASKCVAVFDSIVEALDSFPMALDTLAKEGRPRYEVILVSTRERYAQLGGSPNSGGFFSPSRNLTVIPFESLGIVKKGKKWFFDGKNSSFDTLTHELVHHATQHWHDMPAWYEEGLADYMAAIPYQSGRFLFTNPGSAVAKVARKYKKTVIDEQIFAKNEFRMRPLQQLLATSRQQWNDSMEDQLLTAQNYTSSMIFMYFLIHEDGSGKGEHLIQWMHAWRGAAQSGQGDYNKLLQKHILRGRSYQQLQEEVQKAMSKKGLRITFS